MTTLHYREPARDIPLLPPTDVVVCGGGKHGMKTDLDPPRFLTIRAVEGSYTIPYIRSDRDGYRGEGAGTVIAALGDSITEGYWGERFWRDSLDLTADLFPPESVSRDGRNFPQYAPTAKVHAKKQPPDSNCFTSWMPRLNDLLSEQWRRPVFIANEGWGGITTGGYLEMMRLDAGWQERMRLLDPGIWLIHLGVNDERAKVPVDDVVSNLNAMIDILINAYKADPAHVVLAMPCYDYEQGAADILVAYRVAMEGIIADRGLRRGPDFFTAYAVEKERYYGSDPVHPNIEGMRRMADLWAAALEKPPSHLSGE